MAHEAGTLNSLGIVLGNDVAIKAFREGTLPFPDGAIIAALHYSPAPSDENNKVFGDKQSFVPGPPTNIQFEVKDSKKYTATGGWGFGQSFTRERSPSRCLPNHLKRLYWIDSATKLSGKVRTSYRFPVLPLRVILGRVK